jgi:hypothetical protein
MSARGGDPAGLTQLSGRLTPRVGRLGSAAIQPGEQQQHPSRRARAQSRSGGCRAVSESAEAWAAGPSASRRLEGRIRRAARESTNPQPAGGRWPYPSQLRSGSRTQRRPGGWRAEHGEQRVRRSGPKADRRLVGSIRVGWTNHHRPSRAAEPQQLDGGGGGEAARRRICSPWSSPATVRRAPRRPLASLPAARIESEGYPARRADPCIRTFKSFKQNSENSNSNHERSSRSCRSSPSACR